MVYNYLIYICAEETGFRKFCVFDHEITQTIRFAETSF